MSSRRAERLVNLVLCLLSTRQFLTADRIRAAVPGYEPDDGSDRADDAFKRMFERDKAELRELGVPLETLGLRGLQLSELRMRDVPLTDDDLLGRDRSATRQGMWAAVRTFNRYRPVVSAFALGVAQAAYDYAAEHGPLR